ncbi:MAG: GEVED domain-containing protein [Bacteroidota bacterium]
MKKIFLFLIFLTVIVLAIQGRSQTIAFHENFELPSIADSVVAGGNPAWGISTHLQHYGLRSDTNRVTANDSSFLATSAFSTVGNYYVILEFSHICKIEFFDNAIIQVSNNNGASWTQLMASQYLGTGQFAANGNKFASTSYADWVPGTPSAVPTNSWWKTEQFDISSLVANSSQVKVRFKLSDGNGTGAGGNYGWLIDDIKVTMNFSELIPPVITLLPPNYTGTVYSLGPYSVKAKITDVSGIDTSKIFYTVNSGTLNSVGMNMIGTDTFRGFIPAVNHLDTVCFYVYAEDASPNHNPAQAPASGCNSFVASAGITFPYYDNFDISNNWTDTSSTIGTSWDMGSPTYGVTNSVHSAPNAWDVNLTTQYGASANCTLLSPVFDFSSAVNAKLSFWQNRYCETGWDGTRLEYTIDGITWQVLGTMGDPNAVNWYTSASINSSGLPAWDGNSSGWIKSEYILSLLDSTVGPVQFRYIFTSDASVQNDGFSIDDFSIVLPSPQDAGITSVVSPDIPGCINGTPALSVVFKNFGMLNIVGPMDIAYSIDGNTPVVEQYTGTLAPGSNDTMTFAAAINVSGGAHTIKIYTDLTSDGNNFNDTLSSAFVKSAQYAIPYNNPLDSASDFAEFCTSAGLYGTVMLSPLALNTGAGGMLMGVTAYTGWTNYAADTIPTSSNYIWLTNVNEQQYSQARLVVNSAGYTNLIFKFDAKLFYLYGNLYTNFRVMVNGVQITPHLCPNLASTSYNTYEYELSAFLPSPTLTIDFESKDYYPYTNTPNGNTVYIDNVQIYEPPAQEAALIAMTSPVSGCGLGQETVTVKIKNKGSDTISGGLDASYKVIGSTAVTEAVSDTILPGDTLIYSFTTLLDMSVTTTDSAFNLISWVELAGDPFQDNDTIYHDASSYHVPAAPIVNNVTIPYGTADVLTATAADSVKWYTVPAGGNPVGTASTFVTPVLYSTTVYYVEAVNGNPDVKITEVTHYRTGTGYTVAYPAWCTGADLIEITNLGSAPIDLQNYTMNIYGVGARSFTLPYVSLDANEVMVLHAGTGTNDAANNYFNMGGLNDAITSGSLSGFALKDASGVVVDAVASNGYTFTTSDGVTSTDWTGNINGISGFAGPIRVVSDNNIAADWIISGTTNLQTIGTINPSLNVSTGGNGCTSQRVPDTVFVTGTPACDVGVINIDAPVSGIELGSAETVTVEVKNYGTSPQSNIPVSFSVNGGTAMTEIIAGTVASGDTVIYSFAATVDFSVYATYNLAAYTTLSCDNVQVNDSLSYSITNSPLEYCISTSTSPAAYEDIGNVTFSNINNGNPLPVTYNTTALYGYSDFTSLPPALLSSGVTYPVSVSIISASGFYTTYVKVFIDYNRDGVFDVPAETAFEAQSTSTMSTVSGNVTVPVGAVTGQLIRMRVVAVEGGSTTSVLPCGTYLWGETEDYFVYISPPIPHDAGVTEIIRPASAENEGAVVPVQVVIRNFGTGAIYNSDNMYIAYSVNGGTAVTSLYTGGPLLPAVTDTVTLSNITITPGNNSVCAYTILSNDSNTFNDQTCKSYYGNPLYDAGVVEIIQPPAVVAVGSSQPVEVVFMNFGANTIASMNLAYTINGGSPVVQSWAGSLASGVQDTITLPSFTAPAATFNICSFTMLTSDGDHSNDTTCISSFGLNKVYLPYCDDFDDTLVAWYDQSAVSGSMWELGTPSYGTTNSAYSAPNAWDVNLATAYTNNAESYLYTQIFSFTNISDAQMSFWQNRACEQGWDGTRIDYTTDGGAAWQVLGSVTSPNAVNWYTNSNLTSSGLPAWDGASGGWIKSEYLLSELDSLPDVQFRFVFTSDGSVIDAGFSMDDFCILADTYTDAGITKIILPAGTLTNITNTTVQATIRNYGSSVLTSVPVRYVVNNADSVTEYWTGTLQSGDSADYTFTVAYLPPTLQFYTLCVKTTDMYDSIPANNEKCRQYYTNVGIDEISENSLFLGQNVPNPTNGYTTISYYLPENGEGVFYIMNSIGQKIYSKILKAAAGEHQMEIDISNWNAGIYYYVLEFSDDRLYRKMVVVK